MSQCTQNGLGRVHFECMPSTLWLLVVCKREKSGIKKTVKYWPTNLVGASRAMPMDFWKCFRIAKIPPKIPCHFCSFCQVSTWLLIIKLWQPWAKRLWNCIFYWTHVLVYKTCINFSCHVLVHAIRYKQGEPKFTCEYIHILYYTQTVCMFSFTWTPSQKRFSQKSRKKKSFWPTDVIR